MDEIHIRAWGRVQGVFFRRAAQRVAEKLGLKGYVRNCSDGGIEICYLGEQERAEPLLAAIKKSNPFIRIDRHHVETKPPSHSYSSFDIKN